ncbi:alpha/beta-Hydrolases superfamily protein [Rhynchospora pubera]|uniref:Alpha/beta-Hydrolases superfamily protein n=1 Tax=Rhynchospora pubera TaxID=906938 RepID=A0AAV8GSF6_9POAL|nr:alpha/beta-Hydrolases superfamily protein [Rhynchospora pubera]
MGNKPSIQPPMKMPWKDRLLLSLAGLDSLARRRNGTVNRRLFSLLMDPYVAANPKPASGVCTSDFTIDSSRNLYVRVFASSDPSIQGKLIPVIVLFHGGGFSFYSPSSKPYDTLCRRISRETSAVVVSVNYRLAPEHKYPAAYDDCTDVLKFLDSDGTRSIDALSNLELDFGNCFLAGDSAGGNIVHHVARRWAASTQNWKKIKLAGAILLQPFFGGEERTESEIRLKKALLISPNKCDWAWKTFLPEDANRNHEAAYVFNSIKEGIEEAFPPALVVVGGFDPLHDWQIRYYEALKEKGKQVRLVEYPDAFHAFYVFPKFSDTPKLMEEIDGFVQANRSI